VAHAALSIGLWNNMMQREGDKDTTLDPATVRIVCPAGDARAAAVMRCRRACLQPLTALQPINTSVERRRVPVPPINRAAPCVANLQRALTCCSQQRFYLFMRKAAGARSLMLDGGVECSECMHSAHDKRARLHTAWRVLISNAAHSSFAEVKLAAK